MIRMSVRDENGIYYGKLVQWDSGRADTRQQLSKRGVEIRICQEFLAGKLN
jgi:hypothetical protein